jgi:hypothetical protein
MPAINGGGQPAARNSFFTGGNQQPLSQYGPMAGGYQFAPQAPTGSGFNTGLPNHNLGYAQMPNYGTAAPVSGSYGGRGSGIISGGAKGNFGHAGYESAAAREAAIAGAQESFNGMKQSIWGARQTGGADVYGHQFSK